MTSNSINWGSDDARHERSRFRGLLRTRCANATSIVNPTSGTHSFGTRHIWGQRMHVHYGQHALLPTCIMANMYNDGTCIMANMHNECTYIYCVCTRLHCMESAYSFCVCTRLHYLDSIYSCLYDFKLSEDPVGCMSEQTWWIHFRNLNFENQADEEYYSWS